ncbi:hypothetical protein O3P69_015156 [Scylla paramamosain]|uniref:Fibrinogen C-terminal domain-containing protein n=1 Tax=Scylla paramamosain TaxID=85552 RepID=A0AAW0T312_SCYPA
MREDVARFNEDLVALMRPLSRYQEGDRHTGERKWGTGSTAVRVKWYSCEGCSPAASTVTIHEGYRGQATGVTSGNAGNKTKNQLASPPTPGAARAQVHRASPINTWNTRLKVYSGTDRGATASFTSPPGLSTDAGIDSESTTESTTSTETTPLPTTTAATSTATTATITEIPSDCADLLMAGVKVSGVYYIYPFTCTCSGPIQVWCDMETDGGGWTVFLKRQGQTDQLDFNRTWEEYKAGFGDPYEEYWLGLEMLHIMTYGRMYSVRLDLETTELKREHATYENIKVDSEEEKYKAILAGRENGSPKTSTYKEHIELTCPYSVQLNVTRLQLKIRPALCDAPFKAIHLRDMSCGC